MKKIMLNMLFLSYSAVAMFIMGAAIFFPFAAQYDDFPKWTGWLIYPLALFIATSEGKVYGFFKKEDVI